MENEVSILARDVDKAPTGEDVIQRLLAGIVKLQREHALLTTEHVQMVNENREMRAMVDKMLDQMLLLANLVDSDHAFILVLQGQRHQGGIVQ
jgi:hypothetical protein